MLQGWFSLERKHTQKHKRTREHVTTPATSAFAASVFVIFFCAFLSFSVRYLTVRKLGRELKKELVVVGGGEGGGVAKNAKILT